jgi:hypothetical protein
MFLWKQYMSKENIKIIQNILKKQNKYDLAIKLENAYYTKHIIEEDCDWEKVTLNIFVHPNYFLELKNLLHKDVLIELLQNCYDSSTYIYSVEFKIDTNINLENISDTLYIFVDEAGDMDFSQKGSKHYMFNFLIKRRPFNLHEYISNYRYSLLERSLNPLNDRLDIERFHACEDNKYIREELFNIITTFDEKTVKTYSYILDKPKVSPEKRKEKDQFYIDNLSYAIQRLLDKLGIDKNFIIVTDRLAVKQNKRKQVGALKKGIKGYLKSKNLKIRYDIFHHCSASSANLQIVDYISWAIFRKFEHGNDSYFKKIEKYLIQIDEMTKDRNEVHYEK